MNTLQQFAITSLDTARQVAPAIFATEPDKRVSDRYSFISSADILTALTDDGWALTHVHTSARGRGASRSAREFGQHLMRFTRTNDIRSNGNESRFEICILNSHDRTRRFMMGAGVFRFICSNGLFVMDNSIEQMRRTQIPPDHRITHIVRPNPVDLVNAAKDLGQHATRVIDRTTAMRETEMAEDDASLFATHAVKFRYRGSPTDLSPNLLLSTVRRSEDAGQDVWHVLNRVQEHLTVGGLFTGHRHTRPMVSLEEQVHVNRELWRVAALYLDDREKFRSEIHAALERN